MQILVLPGWYPGIVEPFNGDFIREQVALLRRQGVKMDLIYCDLNIALLKYGQLTLSTTLHSDRHGNIDIIHSGSFWPKNNSWGLNRYIKVFLRQVSRYIATSGIPDAIHAHTYLGGMIASEVKMKFNTPYIITEHYTGWLDNSIPALHRTKGIQAYNNADLITAVSPFLQERLAPLTSTAVTFLPNFIDTRIFSENPLINSSEFESFICVGDLIPRKQFHLALKAFAELDSSRANRTLTIVGKGPEDQRLRGLSRQLRIEDKVTFAGQKNKYELAAIFSNTDVLLHPSRLETFGLVIAEALCCGLSVVSFDNGGISAFNDLPGIHVCKEMNVHSFKNEITRLCSSTSYASRRQISAAAARRFGVAENSAELRKYYECLLV